MVRFLYGRTVLHLKNGSYTQKPRPTATVGTYISRLGFHAPVASKVARSQQQYRDRTAREDLPLPVNDVAF